MRTLCLLSGSRLLHSVTGAPPRPHHPVFLRGNLSRRPFLSYFVSSLSRAFFIPGRRCSPDTLSSVFPRPPPSLSRPGEDVCAPRTHPSFPYIYVRVSFLLSVRAPHLSPSLSFAPVTRGETPSLLLIDPRFLVLIHTPTPRTPLRRKSELLAPHPLIYIGLSSPDATTSTSLDHLLRRALYRYMVCIRTVA